jgi:tRNA nucleotidyltransferase (CCA-adding enzyme)
VEAAGGRALLVGGFVRDLLLMSVESKDCDVEVYRIAPEQLKRVLSTLGTVNTVGESFAVYKLVYQDQRAAGADPLEESTEVSRYEIDVSIPRRESRSGTGHRGFTISGDPSMTYMEAARRRDFTINAILYDPLTSETLDFWGGRKDLEQRVLRAVDESTFVEDSLRVLRAVQLAARYGMSVEPRTADLCRTIDLSDLPRERVWGEIEKLLGIAQWPSIGLSVARELGALEQVFPEISAAGAVSFDITSRALDAAVPLVDQLAKPARISVMLAVLCHRLARADVESLLDRWGIHTLGGVEVRAVVKSLVAEQTRPREFISRGATDGEYRRLARVVDLDLLYRMATASSGEAERNLDSFIERARSLGVEHEAPAPLVLGRHLLEVGVEPGPQMGDLLRKVYELQLDDEVTTAEEGVRAALGLISAASPTHPDKY